MDADTGDIKFFSCSFEENNGSQFLCGGVKRYDRINLSGCLIRVGGGSTSGRDAVIFGAPESLLEECDIDVGDRPTNVLFIWPNSANAIGSFSLYRNRIRGAGELIRTNNCQAATIAIENNEFTHAGPGRLSRFAWRI